MGNRTKQTERGKAERERKSTERERERGALSGYYKRERERLLLLSEV